MVLFFGHVANFRPHGRTYMREEKEDRPVRQPKPGQIERILAARVGELLKKRDKHSACEKVTA